MLKSAFQVKCSINDNISIQEDRVLLLLLHIYYLRIKGSQSKKATDSASDSVNVWLIICEGK